MAKRLISPTQFIDRFVQKTEEGKPLVLTPHQRQILDLAFELLALWNLFIYSAVKKSGKTLITALIVLWWAFVHPGDEMVLLANDQEQSIGRVHKVAAGLIRHNPRRRRSAGALFDDTLSERYYLQRADERGEHSGGEQSGTFVLG